VRLPRNRLPHTLTNHYPTFAQVKETDIGLAADVGTLTRLPKLGVPLTWVKEICYTSRVFGPEEALRVGFVSEVCKNKAEAVERACAVAREIAAKSPVAVQGTKALVDWSRDRSVADGEFCVFHLFDWTQGM